MLNFIISLTISCAILIFIWFIVRPDHLKELCHQTIYLGKTEKFALIVWGIEGLIYWLIIFLLEKHEGNSILAILEYIGGVLFGLLTVVNLFLQVRAHDNDSELQDNNQESQNNNSNHDHSDN